MVLNLEFFCQGLNGVVQEMGALIAHQNYQTSKSTDDVLKEELCSCSSITIPYCFGLYPSVRYYIPVMMYLTPVRFPGGLIGPTNSIAHLSNARNVTCGRNDISSHREGFPTLWQISQHLQNSLVSLCKVGHHNPAVRIFCAVGFPAK